MSPVAKRWTSRSVVAAGALGAALLAWREGGGADARLPLPAAASAQERPAASGHGAAAYEVTTRLLDALGEASIDAPSLAASQPYLVPYWRKMRAPWTRLTGQAASMALTLAFRTSHEPEKQTAVAVPTGGAWVPQARIWNMNEGSFEERECILAPSPATVAFRVALPPRARLRVAPAIVAPLPMTTVFAATLVDAAGREHELSTTRIAGTAARQWRDLDLDLGAWGGQRVEIRLQTSAERPASDEPTWSPPAPSADAGAGPGAGADAGAGAGAVAGAGADAGAAEVLRVPPCRSRCGATRSSSPSSRRRCPTTCSGSSWTRCAPTSSPRCTTPTRTARSAPRRARRSTPCCPRSPV